MEDEKYLGQYYDEEMPIPEIRNTGVLYEQYLYSFYRDRGMIPAGFTPPKMGGHGIDLKLFMKNYNINKAVRRRAIKLTTGIPFAGVDIGAEVGIELKLSSEDDYGSSALSYNYNKKEWLLTGRNTEENIENRKLLTAANVIQTINSRWKSRGAPKRFRYKSGRPPTLPRDAIEFDKANFPETLVTMPGIASACANYYTAKQCHYINISSSGLYYFNQDPLGLVGRYGIKRFSDSVSSMGVRFRTKQGGSFGFAVAMKITGTVTDSPVNLNDSMFADELRDDASECKNATYALKQYKDMQNLKGLGQYYG